VVHKKIKMKQKEEKNWKKPKKKGLMSKEIDEENRQFEEIFF